MKNQALFSSNDKTKKLKCRLLQFLFGTLRVNKSRVYPVRARARVCACVRVCVCSRFVSDP